MQGWLSQRLQLCAMSCHLHLATLISAQFAGPADSMFEAATFSTAPITLTVHGHFAQLLNKLFPTLSPPSSSAFLPTKTLPPWPENSRRSPAASSPSPSTAT